MRVPSLSQPADLMALQNFVAMLLLDDPRLASVPIVPEFRFYMESDQMIDALWTLPRTSFTLLPSGPLVVSDQSGGNNQPGQTPALVGAGITVEMPGAATPSPGVTGPPGTWEISVVSFEERNTNFLQGTGTFVSAEQYAEIVKDALHLQHIFQFGTLKAKGNYLSPAHDWMGLKPGIMAYRTSFEATVGVNQSQRSALVVAVVAGGFCTLTCSDGTASVYYTLDLSAPVGANVNSDPFAVAGVGATLYTAPFAVSSGQTVLFASRNTGLLPSAVTGVVVP